MWMVTDFKWLLDGDSEKISEVVSRTNADGGRNAFVIQYVKMLCATFKVYLRF